MKDIRQAMKLIETTKNKAIEKYQTEHSEFNAGRIDGLAEALQIVMHILSEMNTKYLKRRKL